jgi:hypothetical protein
LFGQQPVLRCCGVCPFRNRSHGNNICSRVNPTILYPPADQTGSYQLAWPCGSADAGAVPLGEAPHGKLTPGGDAFGGTTPTGGGRAASPNKLDTSPPLLGMEASPFPDG